MPLRGRLPRTPSNFCANRQNEPVTIALVVVASILATLAIVLGIVLLYDWRSRHADAEDADDEPPPAPEPVRMDHDLHEVAVRAVESPRGLPAEPPPRAAPSPNGATGSQDLEALLAQALETACAIPGADAALVSVSLGGEPFVGTLGLARHEAGRLASTLPSPQVGTRSIEISYEYEREPRDEHPARRIERGVAVPIPGGTPALLAILTRAPAAELGAPQLELLEEIAHRLEPALAAVGDDRAIRMPATISVREVDPPEGRMHEAGSAEGEPRHESSQVDWFGRR
jgi:hypothetical protein